MKKILIIAIIFFLIIEPISYAEIQCSRTPTKFFEINEATSTFDFSKDNEVVITIDDSMEIGLSNACTLTFPLSKWIFKRTLTHADVNIILNDNVLEYRSNTNNPTISGYYIIDICENRDKSINDLNNLGLDEIIPEFIEFCKNNVPKLLIYAQYGTPEEYMDHCNWHIEIRNVINEDRYFSYNSLINQGYFHTDLGGYSSNKINTIYYIFKTPKELSYIYSYDPEENVSVFDSEIIWTFKNEGTTKYKSVSFYYRAPWKYFILEKMAIIVLISIIMGFILRLLGINVVSKVKASLKNLKQLLFKIYQKKNVRIKGKKTRSENNYV